MAATVSGILLTGNHASRPSSGLVTGTLYACSDHALVYQTSDDGTSWSTWATLGGTVPAFATPSIALGASAAAGAAGTVIRSDATIDAFDATVPVTLNYSDAAATGSVDFAARRDHVHGMPASGATSFATPAIALGATAAAGAASTAIRSDSTIDAFDTSDPAATVPGNAAVVGTVDFAARRDHVHPRLLDTGVINVVIDGGGVALTTGRKIDLYCPFAFTINEVTMGADQSGSVVVDIWKDTQANYPPVVGDSITASAKPTITTAVKSQDSTLTGWTTSVAAGDWLTFNVDSATTITRVTLALKYTRT